MRLRPLTVLMYRHTRHVLQGIGAVERCRQVFTHAQTLPRLVCLHPPAVAIQRLLGAVSDLRTTTQPGRPREPRDTAPESSFRLHRTILSSTTCPQGEIWQVSKLWLEKNEKMKKKKCSRLFRMQENSSERTAHLFQVILDESDTVVKADFVLSVQVCQVHLHQSKSRKADTNAAEKAHEINPRAAKVRVCRNSDRFCRKR